MVILNYNRKLNISAAGNRKSTSWPSQELMWSEFVDKLKTPVRSPETMQEYLKLTKAKQDELKDVGGFVGGTFKGLHRKAMYLEGRDLITLDLDNVPSGGTDDVIKRVTGLGCAAVMYSTRKHSAYSPRIRVIVPLSRTASPDEYEPLARKLASLIGIGLCDPTTFEGSRMMYWPSCCIDSEYVYEVCDNAFCDVDSLLATYIDWRNVSEWPQVPGTDAIERRNLAKQENPLEKRGVVGAFCRSYNIFEAMEKFIPGMYEPTVDHNRWTYTGGSTTGGAIVYDDRFLYSHHATDPCSGTLVNAFDLIRMHMFSHLDVEAKAGTPIVKMPSYVEMSRFAAADDKVAALMARERLEKAKEAFEGSEVETTEVDDADWIKKLTTTETGAIRKTINNVVLILENDPGLKGKIATDEFASRGVVLGALPWNSSVKVRSWDDVDYAGYYNYMELFYGITGKDRLDNALVIVSAKQTINSVKMYLDGINWDGVKRVDTLLHDYLGAEDNKYTRAVIRKSLCAAVSRAVVGATKYDYMPIFTGPQGIGKSTFLRILGRDWFSDSLTTFEGKDAAEMIQGVWINEVGELTAFTRQETQVIKQFLSKTDDIYRAAYGRQTKKYPRRCVFFGTSNDSEFLRDTTGNRRFWPVEVGLEEPTKDIWEDLENEVDQIWAESYMLWKLGEPLCLDPETEEMAREAQEAHSEMSAKEGIIREFLEKQVPEGWQKMSIQQRKMYLAGSIKAEALIYRDRICAAEIWTECFGGDIRYMRKADSIEINNVLKKIGWCRLKSSTRFGPYGVQRGYEPPRTVDNSM